MIARLLNLLLRRRPPRRELFVHEDDWGQIEVLPASCAAWCAQEMARIDAFAAEHRAPDGSGWTDMFVRQPAPDRLAAFGHSLRGRGGSDGGALPPFDAVVSGTFSDPQPVPNVRAFGPAHNVGVVLVPDRARSSVEMIVLILDGEDDACAEVIAALAALPAPERLLLADWLGGRTVLLAAAK